MLSSVNTKELGAGQGRTASHKCHVAAPDRTGSLVPRSDVALRVSGQRRQRETAFQARAPSSILGFCGIATEMKKLVVLLPGEISRRPSCHAPPPPPLVSGRWGVVGGRLPLHWGPPPPVLLRNLALRSGGQWWPPFSVPRIGVVSKQVCRPRPTTRWLTEWYDTVTIRNTREDSALKRGHDQQNQKRGTASFRGGF